MSKPIAMTHVMEPVLSGAYAVLTVAGINDETRLFARRLRNSSSKFPGDGAVTAGEPFELSIVQRKNECITVDVPAGAHAALAVSVSDATPLNEATIANRPRLDWTYPSHATPGRSLRLIGRNLVSVEHYPQTDREKPVSFGGLLTGKTRVVARQEGADRFIEIPVRQSSAYEAHLEIPVALTAGRYAFHAHNGLGGALGWSEPITIDVAEAGPWPTEAFAVDDFRKDGDATIDEAISRALAAIEQNGGGVLEFAGKVYDIRRTIILPRQTVLRGAGSNRTVLRLPQGGGPQPPYVAITGEADFVVESVRIVSVYAPTLICAPTFLPTTFDEAFGVSYSWGQTRARNVTVRDCYTVQRINSHCDRRDDKEHIQKMEQYVLSQGQSHGGFTAIRLRGDDLAVLDNTVLGGGACVMMHGCSSARIAGNTLKTGPAGHGIYAIAKLRWPEGHPENSAGAQVAGNYCRRILIEDNLITAYSERARDLVYFTYGGEDGHVARNRICDIECTYDAEGLGCHLWSARWASPKIEMLDPTHARIIDPEGEVEHECLEDAMVDIVDGRGVGQMRRILRRNGDRIELDRPWVADPDETSQIVFTAPTPFHNMTFIDNVIYNTGINIIFWGCSNDIVADGNYSADAAGITVWSIRLAADQKVWGGAAFTQFINNIVDARSTLGTHLTKDPTATTLGYDLLGLIVRNNALTNNSGITIRTSFGHGWEDPRKHVDDAGIIVEGNFVRDTSVGITIEKGSMAVERGNETENVEQPLLWK